MTTSPHVYRPAPMWRTCVECGVMWATFEDSPCWACGGAGKPSRSPVLNSQHGYARND